MKVPADALMKFQLSTDWTLINVHKSPEPKIDVYAVRDDASELLASGLDPRELDDLQDWLRYTKPFGSGVKIVVRRDAQMIAVFSTTGTEPGLGVQATSKDFISKAM